MLGGIHQASAHDPCHFALRDSAQRLIAALELVRQHKGKTLVLGGSSPHPSNPTNSAMLLVTDWIRNCGLYDGEILNLGICRNTRDEAVRLQQLATNRQWKQITIVTSALHLKRAEATMRKLNGSVGVVACDFRVYGVPRENWKSFPFPQINRLELLRAYLHEVVGWWVYRLRGWVEPFLEAKTGKQLNRRQQRTRRDGKFSIISASSCKILNSEDAKRRVEPRITRIPRMGRGNSIREIRVIRGQIVSLRLKGALNYATTGRAATSRQRRGTFHRRKRS